MNNLYPEIPTSYEPQNIYNVSERRRECQYILRALSYLICIVMIIVIFHTLIPIISLFAIIYCIVILSPIVVIIVIVTPSIYQ